MILFPLGRYICVHWCGIVKEPEGASRLDGFVVHFSVGVVIDRFREHVNQTNYFSIVVLNALAALEQENLSANCDSLSSERRRQLRYNRGGCGFTTIVLRSRMATTSRQNSGGNREESRRCKSIR